MHSSPQFTRSTLLGKFNWIQAIIFGGSFMVGVGGQLSSGAIIRATIIQGAIFLWVNCSRTSVNKLFYLQQ